MFAFGGRADIRKCGGNVSQSFESHRRDVAAESVELGYDQESLVFLAGGYGPGQLGTVAALAVTAKRPVRLGSRHRACKKTDSIHSFVAVSAER